MKSKSTYRIRKAKSVVSFSENSKMLPEIAAGVGEAITLLYLRYPELRGQISRIISPQAISASHSTKVSIMATCASRKKESTRTSPCCISLYLEVRGTSSKKLELHIRTSRYSANGTYNNSERKSGKRNVNASSQHEDEGQEEHE